MKFAAGIVLQSADKYLLAHPTEVYGKPNDWTIPKGELEDGEEPWAAMVRETHEETGLHLYDHGQLLWTANESGTYVVGKKKLVYWFHVTDPTGQLLTFDFKCGSFFHPFVNKPDFIQPEVDAFGWYTKAQSKIIVHHSQKHIFDLL